MFKLNMASTASAVDQGLNDEMAICFAFSLSWTTFRLTLTGLNLTNVSQAFEKGMKEEEDTSYFEHPFIIYLLTC